MRRSLALAAALCGACATTGATDAPRGRGFDEDAAQAALERYGGRAGRCLPTRARVTVEGRFVAETGRFAAERAGAEGVTLDETTRACVLGMIERAHVAPFHGADRVRRWTVAGAGVSAAVRAMMARREETPSREALLGEGDVNAVAAVLRREGAEFRACYERALLADPALRGRVELRFALSVDGRIVEARVVGGQGFDEVGHCVLGHLRTLSFPAPRGASVELRFPMDFQPLR